MRVKLDFHEPIDRLRYADGVVSIFGEVGEASANEALILADPGSEVAGLAADGISVRPRYAGSTLEDLASGAPVTVNGQLVNSTTPEPFRFIGTLVAVRD
jgi:hypothetical protein